MSEITKTIRMASCRLIKLSCASILFMLLTVALNAATIDVKLAPYYAAGNGTADDTTAIQNAINANPNSEILLKDGTFKITGTLTLKSGRVLKGENATLLYSSASCGNMITCESNVDIIDLAINGNNQAITGIHIADGKKYIFVLNCELYNFAGNSAAPAFAVNIRDNCSDISIVSTKIHDIDGGGNGIQADTIGANRAVYIRGVTRTLIDHCEIYNIGPWEDGDAIQVQASGASDVTIRSCKIHNFMKRAVKLQATGVSVVNNIVSCDYDIDGTNAPHTGIETLVGDNIISDNIVILKMAFTAICSGGNNVTISGNTTDIYGYYADHCRTSYIRARMIGNRQGCVLSGNTSFAYTAGMHILNSYNNTISDNSVLAGANPFWLTDGSTTSNNTVTNNTDYSTALRGFWRFNDSS
ncbi:MAG: right-handed parallel beta-helix repeat-containing protein, partial [Victivallaceae bacterium]